VAETVLAFLLSPFLLLSQDLRMEQTYSSGLLILMLVQGGRVQREKKNKPEKRWIELIIFTLTITTTT
jgi:hypothetical protein